MIDKNYWKEYYLNQQNENCAPSRFCTFVMAELPKHTVNFLYKQPLMLLDAGCGNGRDTYALSQMSDETTGMDSSGFLPKGQARTQFVTDDFTRCDKARYNIIYSRFTYHSITDEQQHAFLRSIERSGTILCIETRSDKSKGEARVTGDGHYRNFTNATTLRTQLATHNFDLLYFCEGNGVAVYKNEDPVCIRVLAVRR